MASQRERIASAEKESVDQAKQIYVLNQELDYESIKNNQIAMRTDRISTELQARNLIDKSKLDQVVNQYEKVIEGLETRLADVSQNPFDQLAKEKLEREVEQLRAENAQLAKQKILSQTNNAEMKSQQLKVETAEWHKKKAKGLLIVAMLR